MQTLANFEGTLLLFIQDHLRTPRLNGVVQCITHLGDAGLVWIFIVLILILLPKTRKAGLTCALALVFNLLLTNVLIKNLVQRTRPYEVISALEILVAPQRDFSFPSGHSAASFAAAWSMRRTLNRRAWIPALLLASLISLSRLYVGVHYPSDVLAGILIGIFCANQAGSARTHLLPR